MSNNNKTSKSQYAQSTSLIIDDMFDNHISPSSAISSSSPSSSLPTTSSHDNTYSLPNASTSTPSSDTDHTQQIDTSPNSSQSTSSLHNHIASIPLRKSTRFTKPPA